MVGGVQSAKRLNKIKKAFHEYWNTEREGVYYGKEETGIFILQDYLLQ